MSTQSLKLLVLSLILFSYSGFSVSAKSDDSSTLKRVRSRAARIIPNQQCLNSYDCDPRQKSVIYAQDDARKGLLKLNKLVMESFADSMQALQRTGRRRRFLMEFPTLIGRAIRGLANLTWSIGRTIGSENANGSLSRLITNRLAGLMEWVERSVDDLPRYPPLDAQECMKRSICEAHNQPNKYGGVGLILQLFFPPYMNAEDTSNNKTGSKYQQAARYGRVDNANCAAQYGDCLFNVLDILQSAINIVF